MRCAFHQEANARGKGDIQRGRGRKITKSYFPSPITAGEEGRRGNRLVRPAISINVFSCVVYCKKKEGGEKGGRKEGHNLVSTLQGSRGVSL